MSSYLWDYDEDELKKTEKGRIFILERMLNYGPDGQKIKLSEVKKYWNKLKLHVLPKRLFELLIWGEIKTKSRYISEEERLKIGRDAHFAYCLKRGLKSRGFGNFAKDD
jgi:hypothetical protein